MRIVLAFSLAALLALNACANTPPTRFYVLSALPDPAATPLGRGAAIGIGPVTLPQYLNRPQIVTRVSSNQLAFAEFDQWGGELGDNVLRALASNLSNLLSTDRVSLYPWKNEAPIDHQVTIEVVNFEQDAGGSSVLTAYWSIVDPRNNRVRIMRRSSYRDTVVPTGEARPYDAIVASMSRNLEALSRDIAGAINSPAAR